MITTSSKIPLNTVVSTASVAQMRQGWSRTCGSEGRKSEPGMQDVSLHAMNDCSGRRFNQELRQWIAISQNHQNEHQHVPHGKPIESRRNPLRRVNGNCINRPQRSQSGTAMQHQQVPYE